MIRRPGIHRRHNFQPWPMGRKKNDLCNYTPQHESTDRFLLPCESALRTEVALSAAQPTHTNNKRSVSSSSRHILLSGELRKLLPIGSDNAALSLVLIVLMTRTGEF